MMINSQSEGTFLEMFKANFTLFLGVNTDVHQLNFFLVCFFFSTRAKIYDRLDDGGRRSKKEKFSFIDILWLLCDAVMTKKIFKLATRKKNDVE